MILSERPRLRLFTLCALYAAQGVPWGFVYVTLAAYLAARGLDEGSIGKVLALASLPWAFKWVWGPIIDGFGRTAYGARRPFILLAEALMAGTIGAMILLPDLTEATAALGWMVFLHNVFNAMQDVSVDALAVDLLPEEERGRANGLMYGSKYLGGAIGGAGMGTVIAFAGLRAALVVQVVVLLLIMLLPLLTIERPGDRRWPWAGPVGTPPVDLDPKDASSTMVTHGPARVLELLGSLLRAFGLRSTLIGAVLAFSVQIGGGVLATVASVLLVKELAWGDALYSQINGGPVLAMGLAGAVLGGFVADRLGHRRMVGFACALLGLLWIGFCFAEPLWTNRSFVIGYLMVETLVQAFVAVGLFALYMDISWPKVAATQFTAYMALLNLSSATGQGLAGRFSDALETPQIFLVIGAFQVGVALLVPLIDPHQTRRVLGRG